MPLTLLPSAGIKTYAVLFFCTQMDREVFVHSCENFCRGKWCSFLPFIALDVHCWPSTHPLKRPDASHPTPSLCAPWGVLLRPPDDPPTPAECLGRSAPQGWVLNPLTFGDLWRRYVVREGRVAPSPGLLGLAHVHVGGRGAFVPY